MATVDTNGVVKSPTNFATANNLGVYIGAGQGQVLVAPFKGGAAEIVGSQLPFLELGAHGAVDDQDALGKGWND